MAPKASTSKPSRRKGPAKREAPAVFDSRPGVPEESSGTVWYNNGKIQISESKKAYRVFLRRGDRVDKLARWGGDKADAWSRALCMIEDYESSAVT